MAGVGSWDGESWRECVRPAGARSGNKGFARRPQEFLGWEEWEQEVVGAVGVDMRSGSGIEVNVGVYVGVKVRVCVGVYIGLWNRHV